MSKRLDIWSFHGILDVLDLSFCFIRFIQLYNEFKKIILLKTQSTKKYHFILLQEMVLRIYLLLLFSIQIKLPLIKYVFMFSVF